MFKCSKVANLTTQKSQIGDCLRNRSVKEGPMLHQISFDKKKSLKFFKPSTSHIWSYIELTFSGLVCVYYRKHLA